MLEKDLYLNHINKHLDKILMLENSDTSLLEPIRYSVLGSGKRIRPLLSIAGGKINAANFDAVLDVGCALELIHCYSLVHDDLPVMDNDDLRRGIATCHKKYDEATAVLVGDALQSLAFEVLSAPTLNLSQDNKLKIIYLVSKAIGVGGMVGGQMLDLYSTGCELSLTVLQNMHAQKTGALIRAAILSGYLCGSAFSLDKYTSLSRIADSLGLLFQIMDDILDVTESSHTLGKTANKDITNNKATYVSLLGIEEAKGVASELYTEIIADLSVIENSAMLQEIATVMYKRKY